MLSQPRVSWTWSIGFTLAAIFLPFANDAPFAKGQVAAEEQDDLDAAARQRKKTDTAEAQNEIERLERQRLDAARRRDEASVRIALTQMQQARKRLAALNKKPLAEYREVEKRDRERAVSDEKQAKEKVAEQFKGLEKMHDFIAACEKSSCPVLLGKPEAKFVSHYLHADRVAPHVYAPFYPPNGMFSPGAYVRTTVHNRLQDRTVKAWEVKAELLDAFGKVLTSKTKQGTDLPPGGKSEFQIDMPHSEGGAMVRLSVERTNAGEGASWQRQADHRGVLWQIKKTQAPDRTLPDIDLAEVDEGAGRPLNKELGPSDRLLSGQSLKVGDSLVSQNGKYWLRLMEDGSLAFSRKANGEPLWTSDTSDSKATDLTMQQDGNLVLKLANGEVVWSSNTAGAKEASLVAQPDGNLVIYAAGERPVWATQTNE